MAAGANASQSGGKLFGIAGVLMALCCVAGPAVLGAAAGAAIGNVVGVAAAILIAAAGLVLLRRWRAGRDDAC
jgi:preprotein translocase subunit SecF